MTSVVKTQRDYSLAPEEKKFFDENGYIGPFTLYEPEEGLELWSEIRMDLLDKENAPFPNNKINYDRHLDIQALSDIISHPKMVNRISSILGPNVLCWRTEWFPKYPGDEGTDWHQAQSFVEFEGKSKLVPTEPHDGPWELTAWFAFSEATKENGCMKVMPGTHTTWYFDEHRNIAFEPEKINQKLTKSKKSGFYGGYNVETYTYKDEEPLDCRIVVFYGTEDPLVNDFGLQSWKEQTKDGFELYSFPGDRFFLHSAEEAVLNNIRTELKQLGVSQ